MKPVKTYDSYSSLVFGMGTDTVNTQPPRPDVWVKGPGREEGWGDGGLL